MALRSVLFVLTLAGLLAIVLQPGRKNPVPAPSSDAAVKTGAASVRDWPVLQLAMAGDLSGAPLRGYDELPKGLQFGGSSAFGVAAVPVWTVLDCPAPLPAGITAGEYLVSSSRGTVGRLIVAGGHRSHGVSSKGSDIATVTTVAAGEVAWVLVRQGELGERAELGGAHSSAKPMYLNRKFDF